MLLRSSRAVLTRGLVLALLLVVGATAGVAKAAVPKDYARGSGSIVVVDPELGTFVTRFWFNVESDPAGQDVRGTMKLFLSFPSGEEQTVVAEVTCLHVVGNPLGGGNATIVGDITKASGPFNLGDGMQFWVVDSGQPQGAGDGFGSNPFLAESVPAGACAATPFTTSITDGDIVVFDQ